MLSFNVDGDSFNDVPALRSELWLPVFSVVTPNELGERTDVVSCSDFDCLPSLNS